MHLQLIFSILFTFESWGSTARFELTPMRPQLIMQPGYTTSANYKPTFTGRHFRRFAPFCALPEDFFMNCAVIVFWGVIIVLLFVIGIPLAKKGGTLGVMGGFLIIFGLVIAYVVISNMKDEFK